MRIKRKWNQQVKLISLDMPHFKTTNETMAHRAELTSLPDLGLSMCRRITIANLRPAFENDERSRGCRDGSFQIMRDHESDTSLTLLEQLGEQSDEESWGRLHNLYSPLLRSWLGRYDVQAADADDLIQDVLLVVLRELPDFRHNQQTGAFRSWLRRILVNRLRNFWRKRGRVDLASGGSDLARRLNELEDPRSQSALAWDQEHDRYLVRKLLDMIEPQFAESTRKVFRRLVLDEVAPDQVAAEFDMSLNAVFTAKSRVLRELRRLGNGLVQLERLSKPGGRGGEAPAELIIPNSLQETGCKCTLGTDTGGAESNQAATCAKRRGRAAFSTRSASGR